MTRPVCVVVGAGPGLGKALAAKFASEGFDIALLSRTEAGSADALEAVRAVPGADVRHYVANATEPRSVEAACATLTAMGPVEVLIYNPRGAYTPKPPLAMTYEELEATFALEVVGAFAATRSLLPAMLERGRGTILFSSATAAFRGSGENPLFAIGKFGLRGLSQSLAKAYSSAGVHIAHIRLDCTMDVPMARAFLGGNLDTQRLANTDDVAQTYWWVHRQPRSAWSNEVELRPFTESWSY